MRTFKFHPDQGIILCHAEIIGPKVSISLKMAVDTGATYTMVPTEAATAIGCDLLRSKQKIDISTASGIEYVPRVVIPKFRALGVEFKNMPIICHDLPSQSPVEGLLGIDFLNKAKIVIDFSKNMILIPD